jgi:hypothetical protein
LSAYTGLQAYTGLSRPYGGQTLGAPAWQPRQSLRTAPTGGAMVVADRFRRL